MICSCDLRSRIRTIVAFGKAVVATSLEWIVFPLCDWLGNDLYVAAQARGIWIGLGELAIEPDWIVPGELREPASDCVINERCISE